MTFEKFKAELKDLIEHPWVIFTTIFGKFYAPFCWPFRGWARNYVYNHVLNNDMKGNLVRLWQRHPSQAAEGGVWILHDVHGVGENGLVYPRKTNKILFYLIVILIWGWCDDDSNEDTMDWGHAERNYPWALKYETRPRFGNSFDLGDKRAASPYVNIPASFFWNWRNTGKNLQYFFTNY